MTGIASKSLKPFLFFLQTYLFACIFLDEACQNYQNLTDGTRKYDYITVNPKCDDTLKLGWYRLIPSSRRNNNGDNNGDHMPTGEQMP